MELGTEISQKVKRTIKKQLQTHGSYVDDELPEYIMVMLANKRTKEQMIEDLNLFLNDEAETFVSWLFVVLERIKKAISLSEVDDLKDLSSNSDQETSTKTKKKQNEPTKRKTEEKGKRKFKENKDEENKTSKDSKPRDLRRGRSPDQGKENSRRRTSRERRHSDKSRRSDGNRKTSPNSRSRDNKDTKRRGRDESVGSGEDNIRREAEEKAREIEQRKRDKNPMDFVKQIAKDINQKLIGDTAEPPSLLLVQTSPAKEVVESVKSPTTLSPTSDNNPSKTKNNDTSVPVDTSFHGNVSLQAVGQYGDGDIEHDKNESKTERRNSLRDTKKENRRRNSRSRSRSRTRRRSRSRDRKRVRSRTRSPVYHRRRSSPPARRRRSRSRDPKQSERKRKYSSTEVDRKENAKQEKRAEKPESKEPVKKVNKENVESNNVRSHVQLCTDFKRKPALGKTHQASSALLKRAMTEVVTDAAADKAQKSGDEVELDYSEDVGNFLHESDVSKQVVQPSDRRVINFNQRSTGLATITVNFKSNESASDTDQEVSDPSKIGEQINTGEKAGSDEEEIELRKGLLQDMSKVDARYAIMKTRLEHKQQEAKSDKTGKSEDKRVSLTRHKSVSSRERSGAPKEKFIGSMVADLEEKSNLDQKRRKKYERRQDRQRILESQRRGTDTSKHRFADPRRRSSNDGRHRNNKPNHESSDEDVLSEDRVKQLTEETRRIKMQELQRDMKVAREGDLRNILENKNSNQHKRKQQSSSEDDEEVERKLREKIKEEKHMRLFGKLNRTERERLQKEREELKWKLARKKRNRKDSNKLKDRNPDDEDSGRDRTRENRKTIKTDGRDRGSSDEQKKADDGREDGESGDDDQWVENIPEVKNKDGGDNDEVSENEEQARSEDDGKDEHNLDDANDNVRENNGNQDPEKYERRDGNDSYNMSNGHQKPRNFEISAEVIKASVHGGDKSPDVLNNKNDKSCDELKENDQEESCKESEKDPEKCDAEDNENETKNEEKSSKKRKTRQEFIVTLDGYDETNVESKQKRRSEEKQSQQQTRRRRSERIDSKRRGDRPGRANLTRSDEEFIENCDEQISKNEEEHHKSSSHRRRYSSRGHKRDTHDEMDSEELSQIDKEILLAEKKLKAKKLLKKSLEQVQNLNTDSFDISEQKRVKTAFVNPHFKPKVDIPVVNVLPLNVAGQPIAVQTLTSVAPVLSSDPAQVSPQVDTQSKKVPPQINIVKPVSSPTEDTTVVTSTAAPLVSTNHISETTITTTATVVSTPKQQQIQLDQLKNLPCKVFPNCSFGNRCLYMHPPCKFGDRCTNTMCIFSHNVTSQISTLCKFYPNCKKVGCPYKHVKPCRFGSNCNNTDCPYFHETASRGPLKWVAEKPHISERTFAVDDTSVASNPVVVTTKSK